MNSFLVLPWYISDSGDSLFGVVSILYHSWKALKGEGGSYNLG